jgi:hypothetical protein
VEPVGVEAEESTDDSDKVASDGGWPGVVVECKTDGRRPAAGSVVMCCMYLIYVTAEPWGPVVQRSMPGGKRVSLFSKSFAKA